jgi:DNA-binding MarR family transcriptional regulator
MIPESDIMIDGKIKKNIIRSDVKIRLCFKYSKDAYKVLGFLFRKKEARFTEIIDEFSLNKRTLTRCLHGLEEDDLVSERENVGHIKFYFNTPKGNEAFVKEAIILAKASKVQKDQIKKLKEGLEQIQNIEDEKERFKNWKTVYEVLGIEEDGPSTSEKRVQKK